MNEQEQAQFMQWLKQKVGGDEQKLKQVLSQLQGNKEAMTQAYQQFTQEAGQGAEQGTEQSSYKRGGKLSYIDCLKQFKKGGPMDCGCKKKVPKGLVGMIAKGVTLAPKLAGLSKVAKPALSFGQKALKFGMDNKKAILGTVQGGMDLAKSARGLQNTDSSVVTPSAGNDYYGANAGAIQSPQMLPMQRQVPIFTGNDIPNGGIVNSQPKPKLIEKGGKLKKKKFAEGGVLFADKGARLERREERQDKRAERQLGRADRRLEREFNYQGTEKSPGVFERPRNRFDEGAEAFMRARQPLGITDASVGSVGYQNQKEILNVLNTQSRPSMESRWNTYDREQPSISTINNKTTPEFKTRGASKQTTSNRETSKVSGQSKVVEKAKTTKVIEKPTLGPSKPTLSPGIPATGGRLPVYSGNNPGVMSTIMPTFPKSILNTYSGYAPGQLAAIQGEDTKYKRALESSDQSERLQIPTLANKLRSLGFLK